MWLCFFITADSEQGSLPAGCVQGEPGRCDVCEPGLYPTEFGTSCNECTVEGCATCNVREKYCTTVLLKFINDLMEIFSFFSIIWYLYYEVNAICDTVVL